MSPYCFDYDLVPMAVSLGLIANNSRRNLLPPGIKISRAFAYFSPIVLGVVAMSANVQLMPLATLVL